MTGTLDLFKIAKEEQDGDLVGARHWRGVLIDEADEIEPDGTYELFVWGMRNTEFRQRMLSM